MPLKRPKPPRILSEPELLDYAVKSLASKMKSERDLRRRMKDRAEPEDAGEQAINHVIAKLKDLGYLNDERFAADYSRLRQENEKLGRRRVQQGLMQKGITAPLANTALEKQYSEVDEVALARQYVERKRMKQPTGEREKKQKETAKIMRRLIAAGFSSRAVWKVLRDWGGSEMEEVDVMEDGV